MLENQAHTTTTCQHAELVIIRKIYKKDIQNVFQQFWRIKLKRSEEWIKKVFEYILNHLWSDGEHTADIWNGRWSTHMWYDALQTIADDPSRSYDFTTFRIWMKILVTKLFEMQSALSRYRFRLIQRLGNPMFEQSKGIPEIVKKRLLDQIPRPLKTKKTRVRKGLQEKPLAAGKESHVLVDSVVKKRRSREFPIGEDGDNKPLGRKKLCLNHGVKKKRDGADLLDVTSSRDDGDTIEPIYHPKRQRKRGFLEYRTIYTKKTQRHYRSRKLKFNRMCSYNERYRSSQAEQPKKHRIQLYVKEKKRKRRRITPHTQE
jgi:hypothetical protein